jgi:hypothetical protein
LKILFEDLEAMDVSGQHRIKLLGDVLETNDVFVEPEGIVTGTYGSAFKTVVNA